MSRLEELIKDKCPNGVKFDKLSNVLVSIKTGLNPRKILNLIQVMLIIIMLQ